MQPDAIESRPEVQALTTQIGQLEAVAGRAVTTAEEYQASAETLRQVKAAQKRLEETRTSLTGPINAALRRLNDFFRAPADRLVNAERLIKRGMVAFDEEQDRIRREKQRQADEEARQARERAEREAAAAREKAEREARELRERADKEAEAGRLAEAAKLAQRAESKIERAEVKAETLQQAAAATVAPIVQAEAPRVRGVATREVWKCAVEDASKIPREYLVVDEVKLRKVVAALKGDTRIPGVRVWAEKQIAAGAA